VAKQTKKQKLQARKRRYERQIKKHPAGAKKRKRAKWYLKGVIQRIRSLNKKLRRRKKRQAAARKRLGNGPWAGCESWFEAILNDVARKHGIPITSAKRWATYGNPGSDHYMGNTDAFAQDYATANNRAFAQALKDALRPYGARGPVVDYGSFYIRAPDGDRFRVQIIYSTHGTGPHTHCGIAQA
jgi:hypothetical protein